MKSRHEFSTFLYQYGLIEVKEWGFRHQLERIIVMNGRFTFMSESTLWSDYLALNSAFALCDVTQEGNRSSWDP